MASRPTACAVTDFIGVLMLDTAFERIYGDAGYIESYHLPARLYPVKGADSTEIVRDGPLSKKLVGAFCDAARLAQADGAIAITSTCGFLISVQDDIAQAVTVPVMVSALSLLPTLHAAHGRRPIGIITADKNSLGPLALRCAGAGLDQIVIAGMDDCPAFASAFLARKADQAAMIDQDAIRSTAVAQAQSLCNAHPAIGAFLLECGNLPPYAQAIRAKTGKPVYSILDAARLIASPGGAASLDR